MNNSRRLEYYRHAARFWLKASELQRSRCLAPSPDSEIARADLNFYVVAVQRIREVARMSADRGQVVEAGQALEMFDKEWPRFKGLRNLEEHITGPGTDQAPYGIWHFADLVAELASSGSVEYVVRVEETQQSVRTLATALEDALASAVTLIPGG
jgi:hypothetical protein